MVARFYPEHDAELKQAFFEFVRDAASIPVIWSKQDAPSPEKPFIRLDVLVPPVTQGQPEKRGEFLLQITTFPVDSDDDENSAEVAVTYACTINGQAITADVTEDAKASDCQTAIIDAIEASAANVAVGRVGEAAILVVRNAPTDSLTITGLDNVALRLAQMSLHDGIATFTIEAITGDDSAAARAKEVELGLGKDSLREALNAGGWGSVNAISWRTPSRVVGAKWEQRAGFDLRLRCKMRSLEILDFIEEAVIDTGIVGALAP